MNPFYYAVMNGITVSDAIRILNPKRVSKHKTPAGKGRVRLNKDSSIRKLMRAARREKLDSYSKLTIKLAMTSAGLQ